jgi:hypothetical protein
LNISGYSVSEDGPGSAGEVRAHELLLDPFGCVKQKPFSTVSQRHAAQITFFRRSRTTRAQKSQLDAHIPYILGEKSLINQGCKLFPVTSARHL